MINKENDTRSNFITELHGLRGVALFLVVAFHLFAGGKVSGGVDVFLFLSGFLITRSLVGRFSRRDPGTLARYYSRTASRLIPAASVVLFSTLAISVLILPQGRLVEVARETTASALFVENWMLIHTQLEYGAAGSDTSPLQHFWSLSVQGQFFLCWPLVILLLSLVSRRLGLSLYWMTLVFSVILTLASFIYAIYLVSVDQPVAYFSTWSRLWQLTLGSVLSLVLLRWNLPLPAKSIVGWLGLIIVISTGFVLDAAHSFPGVQALLPVTGAGLVLAASGTKSRFGVNWLLDRWPLRKVADIAYELYLWHWPILILALAWNGNSRLSLRSAAVILIVALVLAYLTSRFISNPIQYMQPLYATKVAAFNVCATLLVVVSSVAYIVHSSYVERQYFQALLADSGQHPGALVGPKDNTVWLDDPRPAVDLARRDMPDVYDLDCIQNWRNLPKYTEVLQCQITSASEGAPRVVLSGGSHIIQWYGPFRDLAVENGWEFLVINKDGCRLSDPLIDPSINDSCNEWNAKAIPVIESLDPDLLITIGTTSGVGGTGESVSDGQISAWQMLNSKGISVVALRDNPRFEWEVPECILASSADWSECGVEFAATLTSEIDTLTKNFPQMTSLIDLTDLFCHDEFCPVLIGNIIVYRDDDHITNTFASSAKSRIEQELRQISPHLFPN